MEIDVFTLFPGWFGWFREQRQVRNAEALGHGLHVLDLRATTPLGAGQVDDTPYGGGAGVASARGAPPDDPGGAEKARARPAPGRRGGGGGAR